VRGIFELAVQQDLDMPEIVWKAYIDLEAGEGERERARHLYERLLERTSHYKVFISYALMEASELGAGEDEDGNDVAGEAGDVERARAIFERGYKDLRARGEKEDRALLLDAWGSFEDENGDDADRARVAELRPQTRQKWRKAEDGSNELEMYWDLVFPDDEKEENPSTFKFFQAAQEWAAKKAGSGPAGGGLSYDMDSDSDSDSDEDGEGEAEGEAEAEGAVGSEERMDED
jgi:crooked neck